jgi:hypothetical protein
MAQDDGMLLCFGLSALQHTPSVDSGPLWSFCSGFSPVLFPFRCFLCPLVHSLFHPWIAAFRHPCLA